MKCFFACVMVLILSLSFGAATAEGGERAVIPELNNIRRFDLPDNEALAFTRQMKIGWNLGNTFDAINDGRVRDEMSIESSWVGVKTTQAMIAAVHDAGFNTIRIPVSWHNHVDDDFTISKPWLDRVQEVVDWALALDMYVILNTHHDVYPQYYYPSPEHYETSERYIKTIWTQLAQRFAAYDQRLIFESMNEPRLKDTDIEWWFDADNRQGLDSAECINKLNQVFVDTVRAGGGENPQRFLMVPGYCAAPGFDCAPYFRLPQDSAANRLIVSAHAYTPYAFALDAGGTARFNAYGAGDIREISTFMNELYNTFVARGIPVVLGEFGARDKNGNLQSRVDFAALYVASASARGIPCCWWDNNIFSGSGERFGLLNRRTLTWEDPEIVAAMMQYAGYDNIPARAE